MRYMVIVKASKESEAGVMPTEQMLNEMGKFNAELVKAGVMLAGEGLAASSQGARIKFKGKDRVVVDGPFAETKELVSGFWILQVRSKERSDRMDQASAVRPRHRGRDPAHLRGRGFRSPIHAGSAGRGRQAARRGRLASRKVVHILGWDLPSVEPR